MLLRNPKASANHAALPTAEFSSRLTRYILYWSANSTFRLLGIFIPILYWLLDVRSVQADVVTTLSYYLPTFAAQIAIMSWMTQGRVMPVMTDVTQLLAASQVVRT